MKFRAHDTFFIRKGWLYKGMKNVMNDPAVFMGTNGNPMDILGIGSNMVKSLRYWLQSVGLTVEPNSGRRTQQFTEFGETIFELLHYKLASNSSEATAWFYFFNEFNLMEFTRDDFVLQLNSFIKMNDNSVSERSLEDDFNCIVNTYVPRIKSNPEKINPESNIDCPLGELGLISIVNKSYKDNQGKKQILYRKSPPKMEALHPLIVLAIILDNTNGEKEVKISSIQNDKNNAGKILNLDLIGLITLLNKLDTMGFIKVIRTAGLDVVRIDTEMNFIETIREYYRIINE
jgi:hypothetical protein